MVYICIMGNDNEYTEEIVDKLSHMGYHRNLIWSTRKTDRTDVVSEECYEENLKNNKMIHLDEINDIKYGVLKPIGHKQYISNVTVNEFIKLHEIYRDQVVGFYILKEIPNEQVDVDYNTKQILNDNNGVIMLCSNNIDSSNTTASILKCLKRIPHYKH